MTGRERIIAALAHREADRVPTGENQVDPNLVRQAVRDFGEYPIRRDRAGS